LIFVTVGTHTQSFNRLLKEIDRLAGEKKIKEKIVAQIGHSSYEPKKIEWFRFTDFKKLNSLYKNARLIVAHGGAGCILNGLSNNKPVIAVPRLKKYNEHVNDHQLDLVKQLEKKKKVIAVYDIRKLKDAISTALKNKRVKKLKTKSRICDEIDLFLKDIQK